jgi:hypothetical protein
LQRVDEGLQWLLEGLQQVDEVLKIGLSRFFFFLFIAIEVCMKYWGI